VRALVLVLAVAASLGCHSAASVILDLPEPTPEADDAAVTAAQQAAARRVADTVRVAPPIELTDDPDSMLALLPRAPAGDIDWSAALRDGVVDPRRSLPGRRGAPVGGFAYDFYFGEMETYFPHSSHADWAGCQACHPAIYRSREIKTSMAEIGEGESCGRCHGTVAFAVDVCERCHPAAALPEGRKKAVFANDLVFARDTTTDAAREMSSLPPSIFPHWRHRIEFACTACHPEPFAMRAGASVITMERMQMGENCGACHDSETAFGVMQCDRCHTDPPEPVVEPEIDAAVAAATDEVPRGP
jgi:c(7)-type cytochrome triheme protein